MEDWNNNRYPDDYYSSDYDYDMDSPYPEPLPIPEEKPKSILNIPPAQTHFDDSVLDDPTAGRKKKEPLKSPRSRPSISTNRVFSPYGLSFFDDAVTTRELSDSERTRIMNRTAVQNAERDMTSSRRMLTPESNVFPSQGSQEPARRPSQRQPRQTSRSADSYASAGQMPSQGSSRRTQPPAFSAPKSSQPSYSAYSPTSLMNPGSSYSGYGSSGSSGPILTPGNNLFPEDDLSVVHQTGEFDRTVPASSLSYTRTPSSAKPSSSRPQSSGSYATQSNTLSPYGFRADAAADPFESFPDQVPPARTAPAASSAPAFTPSTASAPASGTTGTNSYLDFLGGNTSANKTAAPAASDPLTNTMGATGYPYKADSSKKAASPDILTSSRPASASSDTVRYPSSSNTGTYNANTSFFSTDAYTSTQKPKQPSGTSTVKFSDMKEATITMSSKELSRPAASTSNGTGLSTVFGTASAAADTAASGLSTAFGTSAAIAGTAAAIGAGAAAAETAAGTAASAAATAATAASSSILPAFNLDMDTKTKIYDKNEPIKESNSTGTFLFTSPAAEEEAGKTMVIDSTQLETLNESTTQAPAFTVEMPVVTEEEPPKKKKKKKKRPRLIEPVPETEEPESLDGPNGPDGPDGPDGGNGGYDDGPEEPAPAPRAPKASKGGMSKGLKIATIILCVCVALELIGGLTGLLMVRKMVKDSPDLNLTDFVGEESTKIYDDTGELVTEVGVYLRQNITYDRLPEALVDSFLSVEDSRFFSHFGFDIPRFTKALIENVKTHSFGQGGSTFTMQLVKNTYFSVESMNAEDTGTERTKSIEYKVQQIYLAMKLEKLLSKKEIFTLYLNKLNFGGNIRGVQRAAQYYFGKNCNELYLGEAAMLAGIVNLPNRYNPYDYLDYGTTRRNQVLQLMKNHGYITDEEFALAKGIKIEDTLVGDVREATEDSQYQSYIDVVLEEAMALTGADPTIRGMHIYTSLNRAMQEEVERIQNGETDVVYPDDLIQVAMVSMDNRNGAIVAVGGGRNYDGARLLNRATMNYKQPGSSVKPLLSYALAFEHLGYSLDEVLLDKPITYPQESMVLVNASGNYAGDVTIMDAVGNSLNIPAILTLERVVNKIGSDAVVDYLNTIGFSRVTKEGFHLSYAIGGTTFETTCKELAGAHAMLINKGVYNQPHTITKIVMAADGSEFYPQNQNVQALSAGSAYLATELEANNVTGSYFNYMQVLARSYPVYAKTGTTDWGSDGVQYGIPKGQMKDKWMAASTSQYTNVVWVGYDKAEAGKETYYTSYKSSLNIPGNINRLLLNKEEELFGVPEAIPQPEDVENVSYIYGTFPHVRAEYAIDGGGLVTSLVSKNGLENMPLATVDEYLEYASQESSYLGNGGLSARVDQYGILTISWGGGICSGGSRNISLHDPYNDIDQWGACLADLSWLVGSGEYWATVYCDDVPMGEVTSNNGFYSTYADGLYGEVKVCGGSRTADGSDNTACVIATYYENPDQVYVDENGNIVTAPQEPDYSQYGYWNENGEWVGQGHWDDTGFHPE